MAAPHSSLRLALVTGGLDLGGTTTFLCNFAGELIRRNLPVQVFSFEQENPLESDFLRLRIPLSVENQHRYIFEDRLVSVLGKLAAFQPTVVVGNLSSPPFEVMRYVPDGVFRIGTVQSDDPLWYAMLHRYAPVLDLVAAVSAHIAASVKSLPEFARVPVSLLPYGVPMPSNPRLAGESGGPLRILYLGRLIQEQKRVQLFPTILQQLQAAHMPFHWTIAGEGPERGWLETALTAAVAAGQVSFAGKIEYADVPALLDRHDVFLLASAYEGLPLSLLEAMGHGLVPVVSDLPSGIREVVDGRRGILVAPENIAGYAAAIIQLHRNRDQLRSFSQAAREKVRSGYSIAAMTDRWLAALPPGPATISPWPDKIAVRPILGMSHPWRFSAPMRQARRLVLRLKGGRPR